MLVYIISLVFSNISTTNYYYHWVDVSLRAGVWSQGRETQLLRGRCVHLLQGLLQAVGHGLRHTSLLLDFWFVVLSFKGPMGFNVAATSISIDKSWSINNNFGVFGPRFCKILPLPPDWSRDWLRLRLMLYLVQKIIYNINQKSIMSWSISTSDNKWDHFLVGVKI